MRRHLLGRPDGRPSRQSRHLIGQSGPMEITPEIACSALSILLAVLSHIGALGPATDADS